MARDDDDSDLDSREQRRRRQEDEEDVRDARRRRKEARRKGNVRLRKRLPAPPEPRAKVPFEVRLRDRYLPLLLIVAGLALSFVAAGGVAGSDHAWRALAYMAGGLAAVIPVTIGVLVVAGMLLGIDYGELKAAILKLAAVAVVNNSILWTGDWIGFSFWAIPVAGIVCFVLFLTLFGLDAWEATMSLVAVNLIQFVAKLALVALMMTQERFEERKRKREQAAAPALLAARDGPKRDCGGPTFR
jgi:hypothetical protein